MSTKLIGIAVVLFVAVWASVSVQHNAGWTAQEFGRNAPGTGIGDFQALAARSRLGVMPRRDPACAVGRGAVRPAGISVCA